MSDKKLILFLASILFFMPLVLAANSFTMYTGESPDSICPGSTELYIDYIENTGTTDLEFTISKSGSASSFTTSVPQGFLLKPGKIKAIYTYVTPRTTTAPGNYNIKLTANSNQGSDSIDHVVNIIDCYDYQLDALETTKNICPGESSTLNFKLTNNGHFSDTYFITNEGEYSSRVSLSENQFSLSPGNSKDISAFIETGEDDEGEHTFTIKATPQLGSSIKTQSPTIIIDSCYDFRIQTEEDFLEFCENSQMTKAITIKNQGSTSNTYDLSIKGPEWVNINKNKIDIPSGGSETLNLILSPDYGVQGSFQVEFTAEPEKGNVKALNIFNINIKKCHSVSIDIETDSDKICNSLENTYSVLVKNDGEFEKDYNFEVDGPSWATIDKKSLKLAQGEESKLTLSVNPPFNVIPATYSIKVKATASDSDKVADMDEIALNTVTRDECFQALISVENKNLELAYDSSATIPITIENRGAYTATYDLSLTGTAADFVHLNPSIVTIDPSKSEVIYLYVAPTGETANGEYSITVSARLGDSAILSAETINIKVTESKAPLEEDQERDQIETQTKSLFNKIIDFFAGLFKSKETNETETDVEDEQQEDTTEEDETDAQEEEITIEELDTKNTMLNEGESEQFLIDGEQHEIELSQRGEDKITIILSSDPQELDLTEGESKKLDLNDDGIYDVLVTFNGYDGEEADITYERIFETIEIIEEDMDEINQSLEEDTTETNTTGTGQNVLSSFKRTFSPILTNITQSAIQYRNQIIAILIIILIILIAARTQFHKKILKFFEEEIEEEPVIKEIKPVEEEKKKEPDKKKKEEKKKEEKKKEEKKEEKKKEDEDEDDFIIEFDDED